MPSLLLYDWCLATVYSVHSTSAFRVDVAPSITRRSPDIVAGAAALANATLDTTDAPGAFVKTEEMEGVCNLLRI